MSRPGRETATAAPFDGLAVVVRPPALGGFDRRAWLQLIPAWIASGVIHVVILSQFLLLHGPAGANASMLEQAVVETRVDDEEAQKEYNLENSDIGNNPDRPTNFDAPRIEDISVPGPVNLSEQIGITNADPAAMPQTLPPPPGLDARYGQGGGVEAGPFGKANPLGLPGGLSGPLLQPGGFGGRGGATRERMVEQGGGNARSEAAVARGLEWIVKHQSDAGHWSLDGFMSGRCSCTGPGRHNDIAGTAFGLLPLLGAGQTHKGGGGKNTGMYTKNVERGIRYLVLRQDADGYFGSAANGYGQDGMYAHGLATIAVCEAYGLTSDPALQKPAQRALHFIAKAQSAGGGWRYQPKVGGDTSVVGWQVMALKSGQMAGLDVSPAVLDSAKRFLDSVSSPDGGAYGYTNPAGAEERATATTAVGLLCRQYLGWGPRHPGLQAGVKKLRNALPRDVPTMYYTYYATQVMHHMGGEDWTFWNEHTRDWLLNKQDEGGDAKHPHQRGSWDSSADKFHKEGGRLMMTSLCVLTLEVYYRHLPLYRRDLMAGAK
jgi:hypothetical protein